MDPKGRTHFILSALLFWTVGAKVLLRLSTDPLDTRIPLAKAQQDLVREDSAGAERERERYWGLRGRYTWNQDQ